jgi:DNA-binding CsgD family transcriptional regulator
MLDVVGSLVQVEHATYNELNVRAGRAVCLSDVPQLDTVVPRYVPAFERHMNEHPLVIESERQISRGHEMAVRKVSDFLSQVEYRRLGLYRECYRHLDTEFQMVLGIVSSAEGTVGIALNRKLCDFSERDRQVLEILRPHLRAAYLAAMRRIRLRRAFDTSEEARATEDLRRIGLTRREAQTLFHVLQGKTTPEIAAALHNSPRTVHKHLEHVFAKLGVTSRAAAVGKVVDWFERDAGAGNAGASRGLR